MFTIYIKSMLTYLGEQEKSNEDAMNHHITTLRKESCFGATSTTAHNLLAISISGMALWSEKTLPWRTNSNQKFSSVTASWST